MTLESITRENFDRFLKPISHRARWQRSRAQRGPKSQKLPDMSLTVIFMCVAVFADFILASAVAVVAKP